LLSYTFTEFEFTVDVLAIAYMYTVGLRLPT